MFKYLYGLLLDLASDHSCYQQSSTVVVTPQVLSMSTVENSATVVTCC